MMTRDPPVIRQEGFEIVGTEYGGWIVMQPRRAYETPDRDKYYGSPFVAAFTTFEALLEWLGGQSRHDKKPTPAT